MCLESRVPQRTIELPTAVGSRDADTHTKPSGDCHSTHAILTTTRGKIALVKMGNSLLDRLRVRDDTEHGYETTKWINPDIAPLPPNRRTWGVLAFLGFGSISKYV